MPHIIVEYSETLRLEVDMVQTLGRLHETLAKNEGINKDRIKTRAIPINYSVVGEHPPNVGLMAHATLLLLEGRDDMTKQDYAKPLHNILVEAFTARYPDCKVTLEVRDMKAGTYLMN